MRLHRGEQHADVVTRAHSVEHLTDEDGEGARPGRRLPGGPLRGRPPSATEEPSTGDLAATPRRPRPADAYDQRRTRQLCVLSSSARISAAEAGSAGREKKSPEAAPSAEEPDDSPVRSA
jgi:hypothetical protein